LLSKNIKIKICRTISLPVVFYGCETWSVALREELTVMVFRNRVLRRIFGPNRDEVTGEWRRLHNAELYNLYSSRNILVIKSRKRWAGHVVRMGDMRGAYRILLVGPKRPFGRARRMWGDNIKIGLHKVGWRGMELVGLAEDGDGWRALLNAVMNRRVP